MKLFSKLSISFSLVLTLFLVPLTSAFADCSMTASNVSYTQSSHTIAFDYTCSNDLSSQNKVTFTDNTQGDWIGQSNSFSDSSNATCTSSHCEATMNTNNIITPIAGDDVFIDVQYINGGTQHADSQIFTYNFIDPTPTAGVLGSYVIPSHTTAAVGSMTSGTTNSFLTLWRANSPFIFTYGITIVAFFFIFALFIKLLKAKSPNT